jgi:hypothetical protein
MNHIYNIKYTEFVRLITVTSELYYTFVMICHKDHFFLLE